MMPWCCLLAAATLGGTPFETLDNGAVRVGVDLARGGAIGFLADAKRGQNLVNVHDLGRWIGQSYYAGPKPFGSPHPRWKDWPWNPVSAGDVYGNPSRLLEKRRDGQTLYVRSTPMQWALKNVPGDCTFETWISLRGSAVDVRNRLACTRADRTQYPAMDQELPFVYGVARLKRLVTVTGTPFAGSPLVEIPRAAKPAKTPWTTFFATEHWAALVGDDGVALGVVHPGVVRFLGGFHGTATNGGPEDDATGYLAPVRQEMLDHDLTYEFRYTLVVGTVEEVRAEARRQRPASAFPSARFASDRQHWWLRNASDDGPPKNGPWTVRLEKPDPQLFGPEGAWLASDVPKFAVRAAFRTPTAHAELYWERADAPGFRAEQRVRFAIEPDGAMREIVVDLSAAKEYRGVIRRLRLDPTDAGAPGASLTLESIGSR